MTESTTTLYGIKNCDSCRKARRWLDENNVEFVFHDLRADGLTVQRVTQWIELLGWEQLINRRSLTWRKIPETDRNSLNDTRAIAMLLENPTLAKRPILDTDNKLLLGYSAGHYHQLFN